MKVSKKDLEKLLRRQIENIAVYGLIFCGFICFSYNGYKPSLDTIESVIFLISSMILFTWIFTYKILNYTIVSILKRYLNFVETVFALVAIYLAYNSKIGLAFYLSIFIYIIIEICFLYCDRNIKEE